MWPGMRPGDRVDRVLDVDAASPRAGPRAGARRAAPARRRARSPGRRRPCARRRACTATSSAVVARTVRPSSARACPAPACTWPNAPKSTFAIERFIAFAISSVSSVPEAPTSIPATIRTVLSSTKPVAAAARPVNAFRSEITTGMSAPPIGSTKRTPKSERERRSAPTISHCCLAARDDRDAERRGGADDQRTLTTFWPGKTIGRPLISSCSFANATMRAGEGDRRRSARRATIATRRRPSSAALAVELVELGERDQRRRAAADAVEQRHHLRHRGHLHRRAPTSADDAADQPPRSTISAQFDDARRCSSVTTIATQHPDAADPVAARARASATRGSAARG